MLLSLIMNKNIKKSQKLHSSTLLLMSCVLILFASGCGMFPPNNISMKNTKIEMPLVEMELAERVVIVEKEPAPPPPPPIVEMKLGNSVNGRAISMTVFGQDNLPAVFLFGGIHGEEGTSASTAEMLIEHLKSNQKYYANRRIGIISHANPDGLIAGRRVNENGVDVNRNFPAHNFKASKRHGRHPSSEPEARAIIKAMNLLSPTRVISIHSCRRGRHGNNWDGPAQKIAIAMSRYNQYKHFGTWHNPTPGSFGNWAGIDKKIPVITLELPNDLSGTRCWHDNREALLEFINTAPVGTGN